MTSYLTGQEAYDLYKQGREAWNNWADKHAGWRVDFEGWDFSNEESLNFELFRFPGGASFAKATFGDGDVNFGGANFGKGSVNFAGAIFGDGDVSFIRANFGKGSVNFKEINFGKGLVEFAGATFGDGDCLVNFIRTTFGDNTSFRGASFAGITFFDDATFSQVPDFQQTHFDHDISMERMSVAYKQETTSRFLKKAARSEDASCFRRLRRMAAEAKDHARELVFFAQETRARYGHELNAFQYFPFLLYHWFSDFGRSLWRPALGLVAFWILAAEGLYHSRYCMSGARFDAYMLSLSNTMPFLSWGQSVRPDYLTTLYGETISQHPTVSVIMYGQGFLSLIFIFLIGLALRNKLRL